MKNKYIINNKNVPFVDISKSVIESNVTNELIDDNSVKEIFISNSQVKSILNASNQSTIYTKPLKSSKYNGNFFTNITDSIFQHEIDYINDKIAIPSTINSNVNENFSIDINMLDYSPNSADKSNLQKILTDTPTESSSFKLQNFNSDWQYSDYLNPSMKFSFEMFVEYDDNVFINEITLKMENEVEVYYGQRVSCMPAVYVYIYGYNQQLEIYEPIDTLFQIKSQANNIWAIKYPYQARWYDFTYPDLMLNKVTFCNAKKYKKYKILIEAYKMSNISQFKLSRNDDVIFNNNSELYYILNNKGVKTSNILNVQDHGYQVKQTLTDSGNASYNIFNDINIFNSGNNLKCTFYINNVFNSSFKYGDLIEKIDATIVVQDMTNYNNCFDMTTLAFSTININDILELQEIVFNNLHTNIFTTEYDQNASILFKIYYDIDRYDSLFNDNKLEVLHADDLINNYDYNLKLNNTNLYGSTWPKKLTTYKSLESDDTSGTNISFLKEFVNTINISPKVKNFNIYAIGKNQIVDYFKSADSQSDSNIILTRSLYYDSNASQQLYSDINVSSYMDFSLIGMLEVSQCDGTSIIRKDFYDGTSVVSCGNKNNSIFFATTKLVENLNQSNAFNIEWSDDGTSFTSVNLSGINVLNNTKYLIIKLLMKLDTDKKNKYIVPLDINLYKIIKFQYTVNCLEETSFYNSINDIQQIINNKDVNFYKLEKGVDL